MVYADNNDYELTTKLEVLANALLGGCEIRKSRLYPTKHDYAESLVIQGLISRTEDRRDCSIYTATEKGKVFFKDIVKYASNSIK